MVCQSPWRFIQLDCGSMKFLDIIFIRLETLLISMTISVVVMDQDKTVVVAIVVMVLQMLETLAGLYQLGV